ncbi:MAG: sigma 54-interacting transcriptional regulator [Planctomycetia bacterium]|nr:sigma 54-interacting transcriptional regulator [Planctomycetia bacterium]MCC7313530.1 sigma 54-interacting transcriptional regulator [Planctomycetota bacterium]
MLCVMAELDSGMSVSQGLRDLLIEVNEQRTLSAVVGTVVRRLAEQSQIALARIWLMAPGDICQSCPMRKECPDHSRCLHLVASAGRSQRDSGERWSRLDGEFRRMPLGVRKVGRVAASGDCLAVTDASKDSTWIVSPQWAKDEGILGFEGQPLIFKGEVLGVLAIFTRSVLTAHCLDWLRMIADLVAASLANTRAFEEIERLRAQLELENEYLREEVSDARAFGGILGQSSAMRAIVRQIELVAPTDANVLILGESGTGKELVAQEIHQRSVRKGRPLVRVNCASIPRELYESEFFGHVKGAFTGAVRDRAGRFEMAHGGTLFLDEVGEIPLDLQSKLLRVLQEGTYERLGDERTLKADVRVIAATNRNLKAEIEAGAFRQDLYYRLNVFPVEVPPLCDRPEDIPLLAREFLNRTKRRFGRPDVELTQANVLSLQAYAWPGNVRELINVIERAVITSRNRVLRFDFPNVRQKGRHATSLADRGAVVPQSEIKRIEQENIRAALAQTNGRVHGPGGAADLLGMRPTTLASRIKRMGLDRESQ